MPSEQNQPVELLQGTLDLIVLRALATMGAQHAYGLAARLDQVADHPFPLNQGTLYVALVRLEQKGWIKGSWHRTESNREAKVLRHHQGGPARAGTPGRTLAAPGRSRRQAAAGAIVIAAIRRFVSRCYALVRPARADAALARELAGVKALIEERYRQRGLTAAQAASAADADLRAAYVRDLHRDARSFPWLEDARRDVQYAARTLGRTPSFTCLAILTLALGIGSVTVIYSVIHNVLLDPLPYPHADRLVNVRVEAKSGQVRDLLSPGEFDEFASRSTMFESVVGTRGQGMLLTVGERAEPVRGVLVTPNFFEVMGLAPLLGRSITADDGKPQAPAVVVLRHRLWVSLFGGDPRVLGQTVSLDGQPRTIVGVMPARFTWHAADLWIPRLSQAADARDPGAAVNFQARLRPGTTLAGAEAELATIAARRAREFPQDYPPQFQMRATYVIDDVVGDFRGVLYVLLGAVGLLMIMACCNVANMLLARATAREREMTVRAALGAGRSRIARQLLVESLLLAMAGAAAGCVIAYVGIKVLVPQVPQGPLPGEVEIVLNGWALTVSLGVAVASGLLFGMAPALYAARMDLVDGLRGAGKGTASGRGGLRNALVVAEIALAVVLVLSAGLLMRSFVALTEMDLGFDAEHVVVAGARFPRGTYTRPVERRRFYRQWLDRIRALPGVTSVAATSDLPPFDGLRVPVTVTGFELAEDAMTSVRLCTDDYFTTIGARLLRGRPFAEDLLDVARPVAVVNRAFTRAFLGNQDPIGRQITLSLPARLEEQAAPTHLEIVGEVSDIRNRGVREAVGPEVYLPGLARGEPGIVLVRSAGDRQRLGNAIRHELMSIDRRVALRLQEWSTVLDAAAYAEPRFSLLVLSAFSAAGMLLVALGVYSVMAYTVSRQSQEIAVRLALGARRQQVWATVLRWAGTLVVSGVAIGLCATVATTRLIANQLWNTNPYDVPTIGITVLIIALVALMACLVPARRAMNVDPMVVLRRD